MHACIALRSTARTVLRPSQHPQGALQEPWQASGDCPAVTHSTHACARAWPACLQDVVIPIYLSFHTVHGQVARSLLHPSAPPTRGRSREHTLLFAGRLCHSKELPRLTANGRGPWCSPGSARGYSQGIRELVSW